ncbi:DUF1015 domain-containing protein [Parafilimonas sp.]|uniref:DUF1015 domain-containing protein n=1 Tax=Parafilimonas sp. TaxID=1969739 RepID=UPI0039E3E2BE
MATIKPFKALRPQAQFAKQVASKPYDVLTSAEAKVEAQGNPASFLHITKSEIDLPESVDVYSEPVYQKAKENLDAFRKRDILFSENKECFYIYRLIMNGRSQVGLVALSSIDDYENNIIKKHELTRPEKENDRINHIKITGAQTGNVFLAYPANAGLDALIDNWISRKGPVYDFVANDGIAHTVWIVSDDKVIESIEAIFKKDIPFTYIADGHHRAASAAKVRQSLGDKKTASADYFLTTLFPSSQLEIMDYNRVVKTLNGLSKEDFLEKLQADFVVEAVNSAYKPQQLHEFGLFIGRKWYKLTSKEGAYAEDPIGVLDVTILQNNVLAKHLGIEDQRTDKNIDFVGGIRGLGELENRVNSGEWAMAFSLYPVTIQQLFDIADSGSIMPPKSTWFEPKLRDGLVTNLIYE